MADEDNIQRTANQGQPFKLSRTKTHGDMGMINVVETAKARSASEEERHKKARKLETILFCVLTFIFQALLVLLYALWLEYLPPKEAGVENDRYYPYFRDINIMIFFGFGFLMTFLRRAGYSAVGYSLFAAALCCQWSIPIQVLVELDISGDKFGKYHHIGVYHLLNSLFCTGALLISYGASLGKTTPIQMLVMAFFEPMFYWLCVYIGINKLEAVDVGGGIFIHTFGCYFGLAITPFLTSSSTKGHPDNSACYTSDLLSMAGSLWLWMMWPSFNAAIASEAGQNYAVVNTFLSLLGSTIATFVVSRAICGGKFDPVHIQNATLAGGVVMGVAGDQTFQPATAIGMGFGSGLLSCIGYHYLTPILNNKFRIQDVCGVHNLHGMPGLLGSFFSVLTTLLVHEKFPRGDKQPGFQMAAICVTFAIAIIGGTFTGFVLYLCKKLSYMFPEDFFNDRNYWILPSDYDNVVRAEREGSMVQMAAISHSAYPLDKKSFKSEV